MKIEKIYLFLYNFLQFLGWSLVLLLLLRHYALEGKWTLHDNKEAQQLLWNQIAGPINLRGGTIIPYGLLFWIQNGAALEILHAIIGLVKAPVGTTFMQVFSRVALIIVAISVPDAQTHWVFYFMVTCWALTEIIRYLYFAWSQLGTVPFQLLWLRYSMFLILYPAGVAGEISTLVVSLPYINQHQLFSLGLWNSYYATIAYILIAYIPGLPIMYFHMLKQRRRYLSTTSTPTSPQSKPKKLKKDD